MKSKEGRADRSGYFELKQAPQEKIDEKSVHHMEKPCRGVIGDGIKITATQQDPIRCHSDWSEIVRSGIQDVLHHLEAGRSLHPIQVVEIVG